MPEKELAELSASIWADRNRISFSGQTWSEWADDFGEWLSAKLPLRKNRTSTPRFTLQKAKYRYARVKSAARYCFEHFDRPHTVWLSLTARSRKRDGWVNPAIHDAGFRSGAVKQALYRSRKKARIDDYAGVWLHAPRTEWYSHKHIALWVDGNVAEEDFHPVIKSHVRNHRYADKSHHQYGDAISIRSPNEYALATPAGSSQSNRGIDAERGQTAGLTNEVGDNIPALGANSDIRNCSEGAFMWATMLWALDRKYWQPLGDFKQYADRKKECYG